MNERLYVSEFTISPTDPNDVESAQQMHGQVWLDTYPNEPEGVTRGWVKERVASDRTREAIEKRQQFLRDNENNPARISRVAKDIDGNVIGMMHGYIDETGKQHLASLYVAKEYHGKGVANELMKQILDWSDPEKPLYLGVVSYNERAKAFYRKWGFIETDTALEPFGGVMPQIEMVRKGGGDQ